MLKDRIYDHFVDGPSNCAETMLHITEDEFGIKISPDAYKALGGFGGGMGCGETCGALAGSIAALGLRYIDVDAHSSPLLKPACSMMTEEFLKEFGSLQCRCLKLPYEGSARRCGPLLERTADILEQVIAHFG